MLSPSKLHEGQSTVIDTCQLPPHGWPRTDTHSAPPMTSHPKQEAPATRGGGGVAAGPVKLARSCRSAPRAPSGPAGASDRRRGGLVALVCPDFLLCLLSLHLTREALLAELTQIQTPCSFCSQNHF